MPLSAQGFIIAFTSETIPRLVYYFLVSDDRSLTGYIDNSLSYFNTTQFKPGTAPHASSHGNVEMCRYSDYLEPPWSESPYLTTRMYWVIMAFRFAFVVLFEVSLFLVFEKKKNVLMRIFFRTWERWW